MPNKPGHRRFGSVRRLPSGRYQIRYPGPDGRTRTGPDTFDRITDAQRALVLVEAQLTVGEWTDPEPGRVKLADYTATWISQRPKLRPRTVDLYRWLLAKHITPYLGNVPIGKLTTALIREWRALLLDSGVSVSVAAQAFRLLRAVLMTATEEDKVFARNPCRIRGAGDEDPAERPVLTVTQVFELAELVGSRPVGNVRQLPAGSYRLRFARCGAMRTHPRVFATRALARTSCGLSPTTAGLILFAIAATWRSCIWPRSRACAGANSLLCAGPTSTSPPRRSVSALPSWSDLPARSCWARPSHELAAGSWASRRA